MRNLRVSELFSLAAGALSTGRMLRATPHFSRDEMLAWQFARIRKLVEHAYNTTAFYRDRYHQAGFQPGDLKSWDNFNHLPIVTKEDVIAAFPDRILATGYDRDALIISRSSGSSGKVLDIAYDQKAMSVFILAGLRLYAMGFHYRPWHKQLYIYTSPYPLNSFFGLYPLHFVPTLAPVPEIIATLRRVRPDLLVCYPSHLRQIASAMTEDDWNHVHLRAVSVNSEMSTQAERNRLQQQFQCPVLDEYSSEELTRIAAQCRTGTYHLFEDINYIEIVDENGQPVNDPGIPGIIVGTNLHNRAMPMIRYRQNDLGAIRHAPCACGWQFRNLTQFEGRRNDSFVMPSGKVLSSGFLLDATYEFLLSHNTAVREFCLVQESLSSICLQVVRGQGWSQEIEQKIASRFREFLEPNVAFRVDLVDECEKTRTGKRNPIISRVGRQPQ